LFGVVVGVGVCGICVECLGCDEVVGVVRYVFYLI